MSQSPPGKDAILSLPSWVWGGDHRGMFAQSDLSARPVRGQRGTWRVRTHERYSGVAPSLVTASQLAGPGVRHPRLHRLAEIAKKTDDLARTALPPEGLAALRRSAARVESDPELVDSLSHNQLLAYLAGGAELPAMLEEVLGGLLSTTFHGDTSAAVFPHCGIHVIQRSAAFMHRVHIPLVVLRLTYDEALGRGDASHIESLKDSDQPTFDSSRNLADGLIIFDCYLTPLLGALSPFVWAVPVHRKLGSIIINLGTPLAGAPGNATDLLGLLGARGATAPVPAVQLSPHAPALAISWWARHLNQLFGVLTDPAVFIDPSDHYLPASHLNTLLTVEQLFRRVSSIQTAYRDANARRVLLFTVLDTLERLTGRDLDLLCELTFAKRTRDRVAAALPAAAGELLLPAADRAVAALEAVQHGFFLSGPSDTITVRHDDGSVESLTRERAAAQYVKTLRNATHGHGSNRDRSTARTNTLLAHHNGDVPHDLALLGYLYLLDVLTRPDDLRRRLSAGRSW